MLFREIPSLYAAECSRQIFRKKTICNQRDKAIATSCTNTSTSAQAFKKVFAINLAYRFSFHFCMPSAVRLKGCVIGDD